MFKVGDIIRWKAITSGNDIHLLITHLEPSADSHLRHLVYYGIHLETGSELFEASAGYVHGIAKAEKVA
jgi:hypothetical protein